MFVVGFFCHQMASGADEEDYSTGATVRYAFWGNAVAGFGLLLLTVVIVFMGLKWKADRFINFF